MSKLDNLKIERLESRRNKDADKATFLGTLLGEVQTQMKNSTEGEDEIVEASAKKMYKSVEETKAEGFEKELQWLEPYLPQTMSKEQIKEVLDGINLSGLPSFGAKMGAAMGALKGKADGNDVRQVIQENYI